MPRNYQARKWKPRKTGMPKQMPIGNTYTFKTRYYDLISIDPSSYQTPTAYVFSLTSLYDPDVTGTGHQPIGFDQLMPLYSRYTVVGAKATVTWNNSSGTQSMCCVAKIQGSTAASGSASQLIENGGCDYVTCSTSDSGRSSRTTVTKFSSNQFFGRDVRDDRDFQGTETTSPVDNAYLVLMVQPQDFAVANPDPVDCTVLIEYTAILTEPKLLARS